MLCRHCRSGSEVSAAATLPSACSACRCAIYPSAHSSQHSVHHLLLRFIFDSVRLADSLVPLSASQCRTIQTIYRSFLDCLRDNCCDMAQFRYITWPTPCPSSWHHDARLWLSPLTKHVNLHDPIRRTSPKRISTSDPPAIT